jgi:hypothetical protein
VDTCPICIAFKARGIEIREIQDGEMVGFESAWFEGKPVKSLQALRVKSLEGKDSVGFLHALAHRHNKEMHSLNGNILLPSMANDTREETAAKAAASMWEKMTVVDSGTEDQYRLLEEAANHQTVVKIVNFQTMVWQTPTENGICHQVILDWQRVLEEWEQPGVEPLGELPEGVSVEERVGELER